MSSKVKRVIAINGRVYRIPEVLYDKLVELSRRHAKTEKATDYHHYMECMDFIESKYKSLFHLDNLFTT